MWGERVMRGRGEDYGKEAGNEGGGVRDMEKEEGDEGRDVGGGGC